MEYLYIAVAFVAGAITASVLFVRLIKKSEAADALLTPRTPDEERLRKAARLQLRRWKSREYEGWNPPLDSVRDWLRALASASRHGEIWTTENGVVTLPNGSKVPIDTMAQRLEGIMIDAHASLLASAELLTQSMEYLPRDAELLARIEDARAHHHYPFESAAVQLQACLGLTPGENELANFSSLDLWKRYSTWMKHGDGRDGAGELRRVCKSIGLSDVSEWKLRKGEFLTMLGHVEALAHFAGNDSLAGECAGLLESRRMRQVVHHLHL